MQNIQDGVDAILTEHAAAYTALIQAGLKGVGLGNSKLYQSVGYEVKAGKLKVFMFDYAKYVLQGRKAGGKKVPIYALIAWIKERGLQPKAKQSINSLAFAIQTSIYREGIRPKQFITQKDTQNFVKGITEDLAKATLKYIGAQLQQAAKS